MNKRQERYQAMKDSWVVSDTNNLLWDIDKNFQSTSFHSLASAVRYIQNVDGSAKKSLQTQKVSDIQRIYQCRDSEGHMNTYFIYRICEENMELLLQHDSDI